MFLKSLCPSDKPPHGPWRRNGFAGGVLALMADDVTQKLRENHPRRTSLAFGRKRECDGHSAAFDWQIPSILETRSGSDVTKARGETLAKSCRNRGQGL